MKSSFGVDDVINHPGSSRPTDHNDKIGLAACPSIPKVIKGFQKAGLAAVEPWKLIEENNPLFLFAHPANHLFQSSKSIYPTIRRCQGKRRFSSPLKGLTE